MAETLEFHNSEGLAAWLKDKPVEWAQALAARSALRVFPMLTSITQIPDGKMSLYVKQSLILSVWRAISISWSARKYTDYDMRSAAKSAASAASASAYTRYAASAAAYAAKSASTAASIAAASAAASASASASASSAGDQIWAAISADCRYLESDADSLIAQSLWLTDEQGDDWSEMNAPAWVRKELESFERSELARNGSWGLIPAWYRAILPDRMGGKPRSRWGEKADIEIAMKPDKFWERKPDEVMDAIAEFVEPNSIDKPLVATLSEFIVHTLDETKQAFSLSQIYEFVESAGYTSVRDSIRGRVNELTYDGQIQRVGRGLYASNNWIAPSVDQPPTPEPGPGPHYGVVGGRLAALASPPSDDETTAHERLIVRLKRDLGVLNELAKPIGNSHPHLVGAIAEYGELLSASIEEIDVTGLWSVGSSLAGYAQAFRDQNIARTLSEPLEPQLDGLLQSVVRQHGALILGYEEGRDLVNRADEFALDRNRLAEIEQPGNALLDELSENADLVDEATRALHTPVRDYLHDVGWMANRAGYSGYLIIRNSVRAVIHLTIGKEPTVAVIVGALAGGSVLAGDPNMEFLRAALPFLRDNATQLAAFFHHSPEMKAYVEWALKIIDEVEDAGRHDPDG